MIIAYDENGKLRKNSSIRKAIGLLGGPDGRKSPVLSGIFTEKRPVVSVIGAGGKTTTIRRLTEEYRSWDIPVIVTTTTHMMIEDRDCFLLEESAEKMADILQKNGQVWVGIPVDERRQKMKAPSEAFFQKIFDLGYLVLIEADGAKRLPCKVPAEWEPVIRKETTHVVSVYGMDAVGCPIADVVFRPELAGALLGKESSALLTEQDIAVLAAHPQAGKKGVKKDMKYIVLLNKADDEVRTKRAYAVAERLKKEGICDIVITGNMTGEGL